MSDATAAQDSSMPDRPAGAVEETQDADVPEPGTLEAMMAAAFFRPVPVPESTEVTSAAPVAAALTPALPMETTVIAATQVIDAAEEASTASIDVPLTDAASEAMRIAAQAAQAARQTARHAASTRGHGVSGDADAPTPEVESLAVTMGLPVSDGEAGANAPAVARATATTPTETASTPLGLLEGTNDVEVIEVTTAQAGVTKASASGDSADDADGLAAAQRALMGASMASTQEDGGAAASVSATRTSGVQPLPVTAQVAETVRAAVLRGDHEIRLILNPGDLGQIDIRIVEQGGALQLRMDATKGSTHDLLAREMPALRQALEARDLRVERIQVSHSGSASADGSGAAWQQGFGRHGQQPGRDGAPSWSPVAGLDGSRGTRDSDGARRAPRLIRHQGVRHQGVLDRVA